MEFICFGSDGRSRRRQRPAPIGPGRQGADRGNSTKIQRHIGLIEKGAIASTIAQKPYVMSYYGLKFLDDLHHNAVKEFKDWRTAPAAPLPTWVDTGTAVVDKSNLAAFREAAVCPPQALVSECGEGPI